MSDTAFGKAFRRSLRTHLGRDKVVTMRGHRTRHRGWPDGAPRAVFLHWTAGAATMSTNPDHPGNQTGANAGVVHYCHQPTATYPYCNVTVDRDGSVYINTVSGSAWHSGQGSFRGTKWQRLGIGDNAAHLHTLGVEIVDKGLKDDTITAAQWEAVAAICCAARECAGWRGFKYRIPDHVAWAPLRKLDVSTRYPLEDVQARVRRAWKVWDRG